ncbi:MAG TPA: hypothetical protein VGS80_06750 [Ktedonobacterales bacterium]|nr:hypothetical protein [Ktedonobacterales bacterium]
MSHFTHVFGYILIDDSFAPENAGRINALPEADTHPALTRDPFALPGIQGSDPSQLIPFGRTHRSVETVWEAWLGKFEMLLRTLYWQEAHVYLRTECWRSFHYKWVPLPDAWPPQASTFSGGPRSGIRDQYRKSEEEG